MNPAIGAPPFPWADDWPEITDMRLRAAFGRVPREAFIPLAMRSLAHEDAPLPIGQEQTISQPFIVAWMTQALQLQPGDKTLEIGTGSGFQTAILCELTSAANETRGEHVYSVERFPTLAQNAAANLAQLGYAPHLLIGDGAEGWPAAAPFKAIIVTAAPTHLPRPLWEQLAEGGRLVVPIGAQPEEQLLWLIRKEAGRMRTRQLGAVRFVPLVSPHLDQPEFWLAVKE